MLRYRWSSSAQCRIFLLVTGKETIIVLFMLWQWWQPGSICHVAIGGMILIGPGGAPDNYGRLILSPRVNDIRLGVFSTFTMDVMWRAKLYVVLTLHAYKMIHIECRINEHMPSMKIRFSHDSLYTHL